MSSTLNRRSFVRLAAAFSLGMRQSQGMGAGQPESGETEVPTDLPIVQTPASQAEWLKHAITLQPWGITQYKAITGFNHLPDDLKKEFGFNAIILLPTDAHNALSDAILPSTDPGRLLIDPATKLTESQFRAGLHAYRASGYRTILYSSIMHCGHAPIWQSGQLAHDHPDWLQRDAAGGTVGAFGQAWLCPSSPARAYTLDYTLKLIDLYHPEAIMLDNNGFGHTAIGFTCYCQYCQRGFKDYVAARCGDAWIRRNLRIDPDQVRIPTEKGPLLSLWLVWRSRIWAESNELFRSALRRRQPDIAFFVNIQYDANPDSQGSRLQFTHEDVIFSETHESDSWYISQKLVLGQSLSGRGVPVWNYLATFQDRTPVRLRSKGEVSHMIATSLAHKTLPWINYPGLDSVEDRESREEIAKYVSWFASHPELQNGELVSPLGSVVSLLTRDVFESIKTCRKQGVTGCLPSEETPPLLAGHVRLLLHAGMPVIMIREIDLTPTKLAPIRVLTLFAARILDSRQASALVSWVRAGGTLIATPDCGQYNELGMQRSQSTLWTAFGLTGTPGVSQQVGAGVLSVRPVNSYDETVLSSVHQAGLAFDVPEGIEVVCREGPDQYLLHVVRHQTSERPASIVVPEWLHFREGTHQAYSPDWKQARPLTSGSARRLDISDFPTYSVIVLRK